MGYKNDVLVFSTGIEFEDAVTQIVERYSLKSWGIGAFKFSTLKQDKFEGTDFTVLGVPMDITLNYEAKKRMIPVSRTLTYGNLSVQFGVKTGNVRKRFETPVLVLGFSSLWNVTKDNMWLIIDEIKNNLQEILEVGMDEYFAVTEEG